jgi:hypothetical protein
MPVDERDLRMVVVAFEDAVTWCATLADTAEKLIASATSRRPMSQEELHSAVAQLADTRRFLRSEQSEVQRIKERIGLV